MIEGISRTFTRRCQLGRQRPGHAESSVPSQTSLPTASSSPQIWHWQASGPPGGRHAPGHAESLSPSATSRNSRMQSVSADCETVDFRRPEDPLTGQESKRYLWQSVKERTSDDEFHALWLTYVEDMSTDQVAVVLGRTRAAIKMLLSRVRRRFSRVLNADAVQQHALPTSTSQKSFPSRERLAG